MKLYTCGQRGRGGSLPGPVRHPCAAAMRALDETGHDYEVEVVRGYRSMPWTRRGDARAEIRELTGQDDVPVLLLDDGQAIAGTREIVRWAREHPSAPA